MTLTPYERTLARAGRTVSAILDVQERTGCTIQEARAAVEAARNEVRVVKRGTRKTDGPAGGCTR